MSIRSGESPALNATSWGKQLSTSWHLPVSFTLRHLENPEMNSALPIRYETFVDKQDQRGEGRAACGWGAEAGGQTPGPAIACIGAATEG